MAMVTIESLGDIPAAELAALADLFGRGADRLNSATIAAVFASLAEAIRAEHQGPRATGPVAVPLQGAENLTPAEFGALAEFATNERDAATARGSASLGAFWHAVLSTLYDVRRYQRAVADRTEQQAAGIDPDEADDVAGGWTAEGRANAAPEP
jgi:hypothetical protein